MRIKLKFQKQIPKIKGDIMGQKLIFTYTDGIDNPVDYLKKRHALLTAANERVKKILYNTKSTLQRDNELLCSLSFRATIFKSYGDVLVANSHDNKNNYIKSTTIELWYREGYGVNDDPFASQISISCLGENKKRLTEVITRTFGKDALDIFDVRKLSWGDVFFFQHNAEYSEFKKLIQDLFEQLFLGENYPVSRITSFL